MSEKTTQSILRATLLKNRFNPNHIHHKLGDNQYLKDIFKYCSKKTIGKNPGIPDAIYYTDDYFIIIEAKAKSMRLAQKDLSHYFNTCNKDIIVEKNIYGIICAGTSEELFEYIIFDSSMNQLNMKLKDFYPEKLQIKDALIQSNQQMEKYINKIHNKIRDQLSLSNDDKPLLISGILVALSDDEFMHAFKHIQESNFMLNSLLITSIKKQKNKYLDTTNNPTNNYEFIASHPALTKSTILYDLIIDLSENLQYMDKENKDILNLFYTDFLKYYSTDSKALGIVLTPNEYVEFMVSLLDIQPEDTVLDICTGTASFLLESLKYSPEKIIGCEFQSKLYDLFVDNCIIRKLVNFKSYRDDCFNIDFKVDRCTKSVINPPYGQKASGRKELDFILKQLESLVIGGIGISIIPIGKIMSNKQSNILKKEILEKHTLLCSIKLVKEGLFYDVGVECCILIFKAHVPNETYKTLFINFEDDGLTKVKNVGRKDLNNTFKSNCERIKCIYASREEVTNVSCLNNITYEDDWSFYSNYKMNQVELRPRHIHNKIVSLEKELLRMTIKQEEKPNNITSNIAYKPFKIGDLFHVTKGKNQQSQLIIHPTKLNNNYHPIISAKNNSNGIAGFVEEKEDLHLTSKNKITVNSRGNGGVGMAFVHSYDFYASVLVYILEPKYTPSTPKFENNPIWAAIASAIETNRVKYSFGRGLTYENLINDTINLPCTPDGSIDYKTIQKIIDER